MNISRYRRRLMAFFLIALCLCFMVEDLSFKAEAFAFTASVLWVAVVSVVAASAGIALICSQGMSRGQQESFFVSKFEQWQAATGGGMTLQGFLDRFGDGVRLSSAPTVAKLGSTLLIAADLYNSVKGFLQWLTVSLGASSDTAADWDVSDGNFEGDSYVTVGDYRVCPLPFRLQSNDQRYMTYDGTYVSGTPGVSLYMVVPNDTKYCPLVFADVGISGAYRVYIKEYMQNGNQSGGNSFYCSSDFTAGRLIWGVAPWGVGGTGDVYTNLGGVDYRNYYVDMNRDEFVSYLLAGDYVAEEESSYITAVPAAGAMDYVDTVTVDVPIETSIPWTSEGTLDVALTDAVDMAREGTLTASYEGVDAGTADVPPITANQGLQTVFPFSIPFYLPKVLQVLRAVPVAPHFEFDLAFGAMYTHHFVIDLAFLDDVALIMRRMMCLLYAVGLALKTPDFFI